MAMLILSHILKCYKEMIEIRVSRAYNIIQTLLGIIICVWAPLGLFKLAKIGCNILDWHPDNRILLIALYVLTLVCGLLVFYGCIIKAQICINDDGTLYSNGWETTEERIDISKIRDVRLERKLGYTCVTVTHGGKQSKLYPQDTASFVALLLERNKDIEVFNG